MLNQEHIQDLRDSRKIIGELSPLVIDSDGEILAGIHRKEAGWLTTHYIDTEALAKDWNVPREVAKEMVRVNSNVQRRVKAEETQASLLKMAKAFEFHGIPKEKIAAEIARSVPFTHQYVLYLLPDKYKQTEKAVSPGRPPASGRPFLSPPAIGRVEASKRLSKFLKSKTPGKGDEKTIQMMSNPELPFTDCKCAVCDHFKECRGIL